MSAIVSPKSGGRVASLVIHDTEVLAPDTGDGPLAWGCYAMVPWAGRIREGQFPFLGETHRLAINLPPHAIHGVGFERAWEVLGDNQVGLQLTGLWPFGGRATQEFDLADDSLRMTVNLEAGAQAMPAVLGWHPCLRRRLARGRGAELDFAPDWMWQRDVDGIPTGARVRPTPEPWDDAFGGVVSAPVIRWPGALELAFDTNCPAWIVYTERDDQICVEPQTGIPNAFNFDEPPVLRPFESMSLTLTLRWRADNG
ncbi:MAG: aldose 1-epimerase [Actinobacteria bacterium]|nr:aldose 1-epimerase [Actinomycetota bacterium]